MSRRKRRERDKPPDVTWPLRQRDAHEVAVFCSEPMRGSRDSHRRFRNLLASRLIGAVDREDMQRRVDDFTAAFRPLPEESGS